jgi:hypothetical protein
VATRKDHDFEPATRAEVEAAVHPFIERFIVKSKKERARVLFSGRQRGKANDLFYALDSSVLVHYPDERKAIATVDEELPGIYLDAYGRKFRINFGQACNAGFDHQQELFVSHNGICGLVVCTGEDPWLVTRKAQPKRR